MDGLQSRNRIQSRSVTIELRRTILLVNEQMDAVKFAQPKVLSNPANSASYRPCTALQPSADTCCSQHEYQKWRFLLYFRQHFTVPSIVYSAIYGLYKVLSTSGPGEQVRETWFLFKQKLFRSVQKCCLSRNTVLFKGNPITVPLPLEGLQLVHWEKRDRFASRSDEELLVGTLSKVPRDSGWGYHLIITVYWSVC